MGKTYVQGEILTAVDLNASFSETVNTTGTFTFTGQHTWSNVETFSNTATFNSTVTLGAAAPLTSSNTITTSSAITTSSSISDRLGDVRRVTRVTPTTPYTLVASDAGSLLTPITGTITVPASIFTNGDTITIYNNSSSAITIAQGTGVTLRQAGTTNTGNRTLAAFGLCTVVAISATVHVITGAGLT